MKGIDFNDLTSGITFDLNVKQYRLIQDVSRFSYHQQTLLANWVDDNNWVQLPQLSMLLTKVYPYLEHPAQSIVNSIIARNQRINDLILQSLQRRNSEKLVFYPETEKDEFVLQMTRDFINLLNKLIYKYELTILDGFKTFINNDIHHPFIGTIDIIAKSKTNGWYLFLLKTSKTSYLAKDYAQAFLQKTLVESNSKIRIKTSFLLNPRQEQVWLPIPEISQNIQFALLN